MLFVLLAVQDYGVAVGEVSCFVMDYVLWLTVVEVVVFDWEIIC